MLKKFFDVDNELDIFSDENSSLSESLKTIVDLYFGNSEKSKKYELRKDTSGYFFFSSDEGHELKDFSVCDIILDVILRHIQGIQEKRSEDLVAELFENIAEKEYPSQISQQMEPLLLQGEAFLQDGFHLIKTAVLLDAYNYLKIYYNEGCSWEIPVQLTKQGHMKIDIDKIQPQEIKDIFAYLPQDKLKGICRANKELCDFLGDSIVVGKSVKVESSEKRGDEFDIDSSDYLEVKFANLFSETIQLKILLDTDVQRFFNSKSDKGKIYSSAQNVYKKLCVCHNEERVVDKLKVIIDQLPDGISKDEFLCIFLKRVKELPKNTKIRMMDYIPINIKEKYAKVSDFGELTTEISIEEDAIAIIQEIIADIFQSDSFFQKAYKKEQVTKGLFVEQLTGFNLALEVFDCMAGVLDSKNNSEFDSIINDILEELLKIQSPILQNYVISIIGGNLKKARQTGKVRSNKEMLEKMREYLKKYIPGIQDIYKEVFSWFVLFVTSYIDNGILHKNLKYKELEEMMEMPLDFSKLGKIRTRLISSDSDDYLYNKEGLKEFELLQFLDKRVEGIANSEQIFCMPEYFEERIKISEELYGLTVAKRESYKYELFSDIMKKIVSLKNYNLT